MKNKNIFISLVSGVALTLILLAIAFGFIMGELNMKKRELENVYESSFYTFCDNVNSLETDLAKLSVANESADSIRLINNARASAHGAIDAYLSLPLEFSPHNNCLKFFNQVTDWCDSYAVAVARNEKTERREDAKKMYKCAREISYNLAQISSKGKLRSVQKNTLLSSSFVDINSIEKFDMEYPTLIYDGPFSDREEVVSKAIENKKKITEEQAIKIAKSSLNMQEVKVCGKGGNKTVCFELIGKVEDREAYALITEKGGCVCLFLCNCTEKEGEKMRESDLEKLSKVKLESLGYHNMKAVWKNENEDGISYNFAPKINGIIYYNDLVKVRICSYCGQVEGIEASGFIASFAPKNYVAKISEDQARERVCLDEIEGVRLCVIPQNAGERFCYEVNGRANGEKYYVYIDAQSGEQVEIMKVIGTEQGELVM